MAVPRAYPDQREAGLPTTISRLNRLADLICEIRKCPQFVIDGAPSSAIVHAARYAVGEAVVELGVSDTSRRHPTAHITVTTVVGESDYRSAFTPAKLFLPTLVKVEDYTLRCLGEWRREYLLEAATQNFYVITDGQQCPYDVAATMPDREMFNMTNKTRAKQIEELEAAIGVGALAEHQHELLIQYAGLFDPSIASLPSVTK